MNTKRFDYLLVSMLGSVIFAIALLLLPLSLSDVQANQFFSDKLMIEGLSSIRSSAILTPPTMVQSGALGTSVNYVLQATNLSTTSITLTLAYTGNIWPVNLPTTQIMLVPQASKNVTVNVSIPFTASLGASDTVTITASYLGSSWLPGASSRLTTTAKDMVYLPLICKFRQIAFKACLVTDTGGIDDKSFNASAWKGIQDAIKEYGIEGKYLESQQQTDYDKNITQFIQEKCNIIITVGFLLGDATKKYAEQNPNVPFAIVDYAYDPTINNVTGLVFSVDEASFLAGYVAAAMSKTGKVGTWGGIAIPPVTIFMDGFVAGVHYYNHQNNAHVQALGWDAVKREGLFINNFESAEDGKKASEALANEGVDILFPVAGPAGLGAAALAKERQLMVIGVDADWYYTAPAYQSVELTSVMKKIDVMVKQAIKTVIDNNFKGGTLVGKLANVGVGLAPFHNFDDSVPASVKSDLETITADIISGKIKISDYLSP